MLLCLAAMYYSVSIMEIGTALAATCIILNFHHRKTKMPNWFRKLVLVWLARLVRFKPRCTYIKAKKRADRSSCEDSAAKAIKATNTTDLKLNDAYDFDFERRDSLEFDTSLIETNQGHHVGVDELGTTHNGGMPSSSLARQRSLIKRSQGEKPSAHEMQIKDPLYEPFDYVREDFMRKEWQDAARVLDRVLLVVSIVIGSVSAMAIFLQSPRIRQMLTP